MGVNWTWWLMVTHQKPVRWISSYNEFCISLSCSLVLSICSGLFHGRCFSSINLHSTVGFLKCALCKLNIPFRWFKYSDCFLGLIHDRMRIQLPLCLLLTRWFAFLMKFGSSILLLFKLLVHNLHYVYCWQVAVSLVACIYFLNEKTKSLGRAFAIGWVVLFFWQNLAKAHAWFSFYPIASQNNCLASYPP